MENILKITAKNRHEMEIEMNGTMPDIMAALIIACDNVMREITHNAKETERYKKAFIKALKAIDASDIETVVADEE